MPVTITQAQLVAPIQLTASDAAYYKTPQATIAKIGRAVFSNPDTVAHLITVNIVPQGGSATAANQLINGISLNAGLTYVSPELAGMALPPGTALHAQADTAGKVVLTVSGLTIG